jgi:hypothetical protein
MIEGLKDRGVFQWALRDSRASIGDAHLPELRSSIPSSAAAPRGPLTGTGPRYGTTKKPMNYRTTRIYLRSLDLIDLVGRILPTLPPGYAFLADQIRRSASSIPLNYLEGCGRSGMADRRRFSRLRPSSRGSRCLRPSHCRAPALPLMLAEMCRIMRGWPTRRAGCRDNGSSGGRCPRGLRRRGRSAAQPTRSRRRSRRAHGQIQRGRRGGRAE